MSGAGARWQLSTSGGEEPHWARDGREVFYRTGSTLMSVAVGGQGTLGPGAPAELFDGVYNYRSVTSVSYAVDPRGGGRFLMIRPSAESTTSSMVVVLNWFDELRRLTQAPR